jgi:hypothetical protein
MYFLRVMNNLKVDTNIMSQFYNATICPVLNYASCSFFNMLNVKDKNDLNRPRRKGRKLLKQNDLIEHDILCNKKTLTLLDRILNDNKHPMHKEFKYLPSRRLSVPYARTERFRNTFVPVATKLFNKYKYGK